MTQLEIKRIEIAQDTADFLRNGGKIESYDSDDQPAYRKVGNPKGSSEVYS